MQILISCRNNTIEECAKELERTADVLNDLMIEERHVLQHDTLRAFVMEKEIRRNCAIILRRLKTEDKYENL